LQAVLESSILKEVINNITFSLSLSLSLSLSVCTVQSSLSFVSSAFHHSSNIDEDAMVGELNIHKQRKKTKPKKR
jgi:hypothetical protein